MLLLLLFKTYIFKTFFSSLFFSLADITNPFYFSGLLFKIIWLNIWLPVFMINQFQMDKTLI